MIRLCAFSDEAGSGLDEQIGALLRNGISLTELRSVGGTNISRLSCADARDIKKRFDESGISVWSLGTGFGKEPLGADFSEAETFKMLSHLCDLAGIFDCGKMRVFSFFNAYDKKETVFELMRRAVRAASERGVKLYHENEKDIFGDTCERVSELLANVPGLGCVYDPANFIQCGESADLTLPALHRRADYFHIKDIVSSTGELVPAGEGDAQIERLIDMISGDTVLTLEPHLSVFEGYSEIDRTPIKSKYEFKNQSEAFDAAAAALKSLMLKIGYVKTEGGYKKVWKQA